MTFANNRSHREELLQNGFSENITLLQRRPVDDLARTLGLAYTLREERVTDSLNLANEYSEPPTPSSSITGSFKFGKDDEKLQQKSSFGFRRGGSTTSTLSPPASVVNGTTSRWGWFKNDSSSQVNLLAPPKTPPEAVVEETPSKFSPGAWGASLSAASRKLNRLRITSAGPSSPDSPSSSKSAVHLDDRQPEEKQPNQTIIAIKGSTSTFSARVSAVVRDSFEHRTEIISKVGEWVANTKDPEANISNEQEVVSSPRQSSDSRASEEIKKLEGEMGRRNKTGVSPEEYIARIKKRKEERASKEIKVTGSNVDDPLGVGEA